MMKTKAAPPARIRAVSGFSLLEMLVAITVTLVIMGSVYGLIAQGQNAFGREPLVADRQQQIRLAMDRIQKDVLAAGLGLGPYNQTFAPNLNALGTIGVRAAGDAGFGGAETDFLEIRSKSSDCPMVRLPTAADPLAAAMAGEKLLTMEPIPPCFHDPGWVHLIYPNSWTKFGWLSNVAAPNASTFANPQPDGSEIAGDSDSPAHVKCSHWFGNQNNAASPNGNICFALAPPSPLPTPPIMTEAIENCPACFPFAIVSGEVIRYQIGFDTDGVIGLFRSTTGGIDAGGVFTNPPGAGWQMIARGIEDFQVQYRSGTSAGVWLDSPVLITDVPVAVPADVVQEVRITLWSRVVGERQQVADNVGDGLSGESKALGNKVTAVRGSMSSTIAPRAAQAALLASGLWK